MYCVNCGKKINQEGKFCRFCGSRKYTEHGNIQHSLHEETITKTDLPLSMPISKFALLSISTFGLYEIYWGYKNWLFIKRSKKLSITVWIRALFLPLTSDSLFKNIMSVVEVEDNVISKPLLLAIIYFLLNISWKAAESAWIISLLSFIPLVPAQNTLNNYVKRISGKNIGNNYNIWEILIIILGSIFIILALIGTLSPS